MALILAALLVRQSFFHHAPRAPASAAPAGAPAPGRVNADDFPSLQAAVDALEKTGGEVRLSACTYILDKPVVLSQRIRFQGVMDSKVRASVTLIKSSPRFVGDWLFVTKATPAKVNEDLNRDIMFFDLDLSGSETVGGIRADNADVLRMERCRLANMKNGVLVAQVTDLPRPWHWEISPGGSFINNCIFRCSGTAIQLEYATQNRIYSNWFVSGGKTALHIKNSDKTWFFANELNAVSDASILIEDDGLPGNAVADIFLSMNWICVNDVKAKFLDLRPNGKPFKRVQFINNSLVGPGALDAAALAADLGNRFSGNTGTQSGLLSESSGRFEIQAATSVVKIDHSLFRAPTHVGITFECEPPAYWVSAIDAKSFTVSFSRPFTGGAFTWSAITSP